MKKILTNPNTKSSFWGGQTTTVQNCENFVSHNNNGLNPTARSISSTGHARPAWLRAQQGHHARVALRERECRGGAVGGRGTHSGEEAGARAGAAKRSRSRRCSRHRSATADPRVVAPRAKCARRHLAVQPTAGLPPVKIAVWRRTGGRFHLPPAQFARGEECGIRDGQDGGGKTSTMNSSCHLDPHHVKLDSSHSSSRQRESEAQKARAKFK